MPIHLNSFKFPLSSSRGIVIWATGWMLLTLALMLCVTPYEPDLVVSLKSEWGSSFGSFIQNWGRKPASILIVGAAFVLSFKDFRESHRLLARSSAALIIQFLLHPAIITNTVKLLSGRIRPLHIAEKGLEYRPFYDWNPGLGDFSFPSGHVAIAMILTPSIILLFRSGKPMLATALALGTITWAGIVAYGRVIYGAHFPSDVLFSIGTGMALAPFSLALGDLIIRFLHRKAQP